MSPHCHAKSIFPFGCVIVAQPKRGTEYSERAAWLPGLVLSESTRYNSWASLVLSSTSVDRYQIAHFEVGVAVAVRGDILEIGSNPGAPVV